MELKGKGKLLVLVIISYSSFDPFERLLLSSSLLSSLISHISPIIPELHRLLVTQISVVEFNICVNFVYKTLV